MHAPDRDGQREADENAIRRITAFYSDAVTHLDAARAASVYTERGSVVIAGAETTGRQAIQEGMRRSFSAFDLLQLIAHGGWIEVDGDEARARWSTIEVAIRRGSQDLDVILGRYEDLLVRQAEGWRFRQRVFTLAGRTLLETAKLQINRHFIASLVPGMASSA